jgi:hypothetical protein
LKNLLPLVIFMVTSSLLTPGTRAHAQLHWPDPPQKKPLRIRLVAVVFSYPRSTFFASHEVLIAEQELAQDEWSLIKLVYNYLPYQPKLSENGFDYSVVHEMSVVRDPHCDETVAHLTARDWPDRGTVELKYSKGADTRDLAGRRIPLPCYDTSADDYTKSEKEPTAVEPERREK